MSETHALYENRLDSVTEELSLVPTHDSPREQIQSLINCTTELVGSLRDLNTSWSVERTKLIHKVDDMDRKVDNLVNSQTNMKEKLSGIELFIEGDGHDRPVDQRLQALEIEHKHQQQALKDIRDKDLKEIRDERRRMYWLFFGTVATIVVGIVIEISKYVASVMERH